jgi:uncharacterized protein
MLVANSTYKKPSFLVGEHIETIIPSIFRKVKVSPTQNERIRTHDDDFLDLDWYCAGSKQLVIVSHGLEGSSKSQYAVGVANYFNKNNIDVLAWNYRGCSEEINVTTKFYHSGATYDLETVISHTLNKGYSKIALIGFSLGGNLTLKYLGEEREKHKEITAAVVFSVPVDLGAGCDEISRPKNIMYTNRFLRRLKRKLRAKHNLMGDKFPLNGLNKIKDLRKFDEIFTGPLHGFKNAEDYYAQSSSLFYIDNITTPTLIVNALNDPFLPDACYPIEKLREHKHIWFETPANGGHVGFMPAAKDGSYWSDRRALEFINLSST